MIWVLMLAVLISCDSPRNNRIEMQGSNVSGQSETYSLNKLELNLRVLWLEGPYSSVGQNSVLTVYVYNLDGELINLPEGLSLEFFSVMPSMGHSLDDPGYFKNVSQGVYENRDIYFQMGGDWQSEVQVLDSNSNYIDKISWLDFL